MAAKVILPKSANRSPITSPSCRGDNLKGLEVEITLWDIGVKTGQQRTVGHISGKTSSILAPHPHP